MSLYLNLILGIICIILGIIMIARKKKQVTGGVITIICGIVLAIIGVINIIG